MAGQITCDMCQAEPATVMQSNLANGETVAVGDSCVVPFYLTVLAAILEGMPAEVRAEFGTQLKPVIDQLQGEPEPVPPAQPARRGKRAATVARVEARGADPDAAAEAEGDFGPGQPFSADSATADE